MITRTLRRFIEIDCEENTKPDRNFIYQIAKCFTRRRLVRELIKAFVAYTNLKEFAVLNAHGKSLGQTFVYLPNGKKAVPVQKWIDERDGRFAVLMIMACNPENKSIRSDRSIVIHAGDFLSLIQTWNPRKGFTRVFVPGFGYVEDDYYLLKKAISHLQRK